jgi:exodeoxyribonuclease VII large subunit
MTRMFPRPVAAAAPPRPYTVSELLSEVGSRLRSDWRDVAVAGEIGRFDLRGGHGYFTLKDRAATLNAVIFASELARVPFRPEPGLEVVARGILDLWSPQGRFQLKAWTLEPVGAGASSSLSSSSRRSSRPKGSSRRRASGPSRRCRSRSRSSRRRREPRSATSFRSCAGDSTGLAITIYPVRVQGDLAAGEIASGIRACSARGAFDVLIVAPRGRVARRPRPVQQREGRAGARGVPDPDDLAVGHETDVTICDLVADLRAATPSAAAELVVDRKDGLCRRVEDSRRRARRAFAARLTLERARLSALSRAEGLLRFRYRLREWRDRVALSRETLLDALARRPAQERARLAGARRSLEAFARTARLGERRGSLSHASHRLEAKIRRIVEGQRARLAARRRSSTPSRRWRSLHEATRSPTSRGPGGRSSPRPR